MGTKDKLIQKLKSKPRDFEYRELLRLLKLLGFVEKPTGKTSGSRVRFVHSQTGVALTLDKPHGRKELLTYQINDALTAINGYEEIENE